MIPDAIRLTIKKERDNLNIFFTPLMNNDHKTYMEIVLKVNILNHLGIASQTFNR